MLPRSGSEGSALPKIAVPRRATADRTFVLSADVPPQTRRSSAANRMACVDVGSRYIYCQYMCVLRCRLPAVGDAPPHLHKQRQSRPRTHAIRCAGEAASRSSITRSRSRRCCHRMPPHISFAAQDAQQTVDEWSTPGVATLPWPRQHGAVADLTSAAHNKITPAALAPITSSRHAVSGLAHTQAPERCQRHTHAAEKMQKRMQQAHAVRKVYSRSRVRCTVRAASSTADDVHTIASARPSDVAAPQPTIQRCASANLASAAVVGRIMPAALMLPACQSHVAPAPAHT